MYKILGLLVIGLGVFLEVMWLGFCFGSVVIGILLLIFAPRILFFPFNFFFMIGMTIINPQKYSKASFTRANYSHSSQGGFNNNFTSQTNTLDAYYKELESSSSDDMATIKKNYRRLIKQYHYDSIASKDLPEDMVIFAEEKTKSLNEAYSAIKSARN